MAEIHVALTGGIHQETDAKLLPQGRLVNAENVRFEKEGRVVSRFGYAFVEDENREAAAIASANYTKDRTLHFQESLGFGTSAKWWQRTPGGSFTAPAFASCLSSFEAPSRTVATPTIKFSAIASDMASNNGYLFVVYNDYDAIDNTDGGLFFVVYHRATMRLVTSGVIVPFGEAASSYFNPKCIAVGTDVLVFYQEDDEILMWKFDTLTLTGADVTITPAITITSPITGHHASFDVCPYDDLDEVVVCFEGIVPGPLSTTVNASRVDVDGNRTNFLATAAYGTGEKELGIARFGPLDTEFGIAVIMAGNVKYGTWTNGGTAVVAVSTIDSSGLAMAAPCVADSATHGNVVAWGIKEPTEPAGRMGVWVYNGWAGASAKYVPSLWPVARPFESQDGTVLVWCVDETHDPVDGQAGSFGTYRLVELGNLNSQDAEKGQAMSAMVCAQEQALAGNWYQGQAYDQRRGTVADAGTAENGSSIEMRITALPTLVGATVTAGRVDFVEYRAGTYVERLHSAKINGQLLFSGPRVIEFDGSQLYESGLFQGPKELLVAPGSGDAVLEGNRYYCAIWKWIDAGGRIHRSQVSTPVLYEGGGEPEGAEVTIAPPPFSDRQAYGTVTIFAEVYRTTRDGTVFYLLNPSNRIVVTPDLSVPLTFLDDQTDDEITDNETIYIGDGTIIDNGEPPPCKYIWAGEDRVIVGGLEDRTQYAFSKRVRPGGAVAFPLSEELEFRGTIEGEVTGVAQLDGVWFVGSVNALWAVTGDGPNDEGIGEFTRPRRLPSDTGFVSQRSICEVPQGLLFQGRGGKMYLLPRGGGAPQWVGRAIEDILIEFPFITCCTALSEEHVAIFVCVKLANGDDDPDARFLIFDTDSGEWVVDKAFIADDSEERVFSSVAVWNGKPLFDATIAETDEWTDDIDGASPTWITCIVETGDMRFFGAAGTGRCRRANVLGAAYSANVNMVIEVSRDSGETYDSPAGAWDAGNPFGTDRQYDLPYVRGSAFRFRLTVTPSDDEGALEPGQGVALSALSFEVYQEQGLKRLPATARV